jgi:hypothetical protein
MLTSFASQGRGLLDDCNDGSLGVRGWAYEELDTTSLFEEFR